ncbi:MAG: TerB family tellurite resistance protein [SAR324 cluster bacterium]|nr:TerB family tellurite resistance protein [SAR324 cluster bacterium]
MAKTAKRREISEYPWQRKKDYLLLVAAVAAADGALPEEELSLLNRWMDTFELPEKSRSEVMGAARQEPLQLQSILGRLAKTDLVYSLMLDMMGMAMADGVLQDNEIALLREMAAGLNVDQIDFKILIEFVHSAHQASQLSNPEPLYEHNIDSAFELLRKRKVRLFPHTLLCATSLSYDEQLKKRWAKFRAI